MARPAAGRQRSADLSSRAVEAFSKDFGGLPDMVVRAPGRVSLLGGHVDYNEGWVLPAAVDRSIWMAVRVRDDKRMSVHSEEMAELAVVDLDEPELQPVKQRSGARQATWIDYPLGVAWALQQLGDVPCGLDATVLSTVPRGAGMSSSAALEVVFLLAWQTALGSARSPIELAAIGQRVENEFLSVQSGIQDQFASLCGKSNHALFLDCRTLSWKAIAVPDECGVVVADSLVHRSLVDGGLNDRRQDCLDALDALRGLGVDLRSLRDLRSHQLDEVEAGMELRLRSRARHVMEECARVRLGAELLEKAQTADFGELMRLSHESSRDLYEASTPELDTLAETAWSSPGCYGARLSGAGFGGCVVALTSKETMAELRKRLRRAFEDRFARSPRLFECALGDGAEVERL